MSGYFNPPFAAESNPPIEPQWFQPSAFTITAISTGRNTTVTTSPAFGVNNNYVVGQLVRFHIPPTYGISQLNGQDGYVISLPATNQVVVNIDTSRGYDTFIPSPTYGPTPPQIVAIGDVSSGAINASGRSNTGNYPYGAFINISPSAGG